MREIMAPTGSANDALRDLGGEVIFFESHDQTAKVYGLPPLTEVKQHVHEYPHLSILLAGKVTVVAGREVTELVAPAFFEVAAGVAHTIINGPEGKSLWACIHNTKGLTDEA